MIGKLTGKLDSVSLNAVIVGSGYYPDVEALIPNRGASAPKAGMSMYLINADTGELIGNSGGGSCAGTGCYSVGDVGGNGRTNALQADPTAAGEAGSPVVTKAYLGVSTTVLDATVAARNGLDIDHGLLIVDVAGDSAASVAGLQPGDVIVSVNGPATNDNTALGDAIRIAGAGHVVHLKVFRNGTTVDIEPPVTVMV